MDAALSRLIEQVHAARAAGSALEIVGGGTKRFYGGPPQGAPLQMAELSGISSYEPSELVVTVRAGTPLAELEQALAERGQCLAFEPPRLSWQTADASPKAEADSAVPAVADAPIELRRGTVGGMVAAGLAGPSRAAVGSVRDFVLGATLLNGRGEVLTFGGQVMKNVAGYDVSRLLAGSMGVLGVICEVSLKVLPAAPAVATLRFEMDQAQALRRLNEWGGQPLPLNASAWWQDTLALRLCGAAAAVRAACEQLGGELIAPDLAAAFWNGLRDQRDEFFVDAGKAVAEGATLWRLSVPSVAPPLALGGEPLIEWGGAQRWWVSTAPAQTVRDAAAAAGGHAVAFLGGDRSHGVFAPLTPPLARIHRELKAAFDPDRLFNPGRLYPDF